MLDADVVFLGIPFDQGASARPGARYGPDAIRDAGVYFYYSWDDNVEAPGTYDIDEDADYLRGVTMVDCGNVAIVPADVDGNFARVTHAVREITAKDALLVSIGGDHSISFPVARGFDRYSVLDIVQFDAHLDFTDEHQGSKYGHGSAIRRIAELPFVRHITQIGIRTAGRGLTKEALARGNRIITANKFREMGATAAIGEVRESDAIYVTIDIDVLDPTYAPGTATTALGGLSYLELREALRALARHGRVIGFDLVEVAPVYDNTGLTARAAATIILDFLSALCPSRGY
jgi:agmatinase